MVPQRELSFKIALIAYKYKVTGSMTNKAMLETTYILDSFSAMKLKEPVVGSSKEEVGEKRLQADVGEH